MVPRAAPPDTLAAKWERQADVIGNGVRGLLSCRAMQHVVDDRADERPVPRIVRIQFPSDIDLRDTGQSVGDAMDRVRMRQSSALPLCGPSPWQSWAANSQTQAPAARADRLETRHGSQRRMRLHVNGFKLLGEP